MTADQFHLVPPPTTTVFPPGRDRDQNHRDSIIQFPQLKAKQRGDYRGKPTASMKFVTDQQGLGIATVWTATDRTTDGSASSFRGKASWAGNLRLKAGFATDSATHGIGGVPPPSEQLLAAGTCQRNARIRIKQNDTATEGARPGHLSKKIPQHALLEAKTGVLIQEPQNKARNQLFSNNLADFSCNSPSNNMACKGVDFSNWNSTNG